MGDLSLQARPRLAYIDNLRVALTILVIVHHVGQAYGPTGGAWPVHQEVARAAVLSPFFTVNRSFFMSLFFMISGYFMVAAYERHGFATFLRSRLVRLGMPVLGWAALSLLFRIFLLREPITRWDDFFGAGHLWYLEHVLLFSVVYGLWRLLRGRRSLAVKPEARLPGTFAILAVAAAIAVSSYLIRLWSPIDRWFNLLGFFSVAFADVPRDLTFFILGAVAFRRDWFVRYPARSGYAWLGVGLAAAALLYVYRLWLHTIIPVSSTVWNLAYPAWEAILCFGMCIGLLVFFRQALNFQGRLGTFLSANQYAAYVWQMLVIVPLQLALLNVPLCPLAKFGLVALVGVPLTFLWSGLSRRTRLVRSVL